MAQQANLTYMLCCTGLPCPQVPRNNAYAVGLSYIHGTLSLENSNLPSQAVSKPCLHLVMEGDIIFITLDSKQMYPLLSRDVLGLLLVDLGVFTLETSLKR